MASLPTKPLDGAGGYLRWKESLLLRVHTLGVAYVLTEARPAPAAGQEAAAKKWARDNAVCRGHILATISDRLLPDYARFATAADLWRALARTYDVKDRFYWMDRFYKFNFDVSTGDVLLEQLAHAEALGAAAELRDEDVAFELGRKMPMGMISPVTRGEEELESIWTVARNVASAGVDPWYEEKEYEKELDNDGHYAPMPEQYEKELDDADHYAPMPEQATSSWKRARRWS